MEPMIGAHETTDRKPLATSIPLDGVNASIALLTLMPASLPKGEDLSVYSQDQLDDIAARFNARPRKSLGWKAPAELFLPIGAFDFQKHWSGKINPVAL
jgi:hypothetical protein